MKILVVSLAGIGDTLFATPLLHELRASFPKAQIDSLVMWPGSKDLLAGNPHLNTVHQKNLIAAGMAGSWSYLKQLRREKYDLSINTHPQSRIHYRLVARLIAAKQRLSHRYDNASLVDRWLVTHSIGQDYSRHSIENNLALLECLGTKALLAKHEYEIYPSTADQAWAEGFVNERKLAGRKLLGIHIGSGGTKNLALRRWPLERYVELVRRLGLTQPGLSTLLFGGPDEESDCERLLAQTDARLVLRPPTRSLMQAAALLKRCHAFLSVDTALMHLAAAMKVPKQIVIETPTWNKPIEPFGNPFQLIANPGVAGRNLDYYRYDGAGIKGSREELLRCMASVSVDAVYEAVADALSALHRYQPPGKELG